MKKLNVKNTITIVLAAVFLYSGFGLGSIFLEYEKGDRQYEDLRQEYFDNNFDIKKNHTADEFNAVPLVDFEALMTVNPEIIAWVWIEDSPVNYPVLQTDDNQKYLSHSYEGSQSIMGSIFADYRSSSDFSDQHTVIYGHNMKNKSMFGSLHDYADPVYYDTHKFFYISTPDGMTRQYRVCSAYVTDAYSDSYILKFENEETYRKFQSEIIDLSAIKTDFELNIHDRIVTLSTCTSSGKKTERFVVHGCLSD